MLTRLDADVVHLSEVESCTVLDLLLEIMPTNHGYRSYMLSGRDSATGNTRDALTGQVKIQHCSRVSTQNALCGARIGDCSIHFWTRVVYRRIMARLAYRSTILLESSLLTCPVLPQRSSLQASTCLPFPKITIGNPSVTSFCPLKMRQAGSTGGAAGKASYAVQSAFGLASCRPWRLQ